MGEGREWKGGGEKISSGRREGRRMVLWKGGRGKVFKWKRERLIEKEEIIVSETSNMLDLRLSVKSVEITPKEHLSEHLTPHLQCKHCRYELKTMKEVAFWRRV